PGGEQGVPVLAHPEVGGGQGPGGGGDVAQDGRCFGEAGDRVGVRGHLGDEATLLEEVAGGQDRLVSDDVGDLLQVSSGVEAAAAGFGDRAELGGCAFAGGDDGDRDALLEQLGGVVLESGQLARVGEAV